MRAAVQGGSAWKHLLISQKERTRLGVMQQVKKQQLSLVAAAEVLRLSYRQVKRIWRRYEQSGDQGLVHRSRGRASNRAKQGSFKEGVLARYQARYADFGPTLAAEHLGQEGLEVDHETLRRWLLARGLWTIQRRRQKHRQWRERKACFGQLVQMDGSHHDWFEGRGQPAVLMVMIDDTTNCAYARFSEQETTRAAYEVFEGYVRRYGLPQGLYVDQDSIYKTTREPSVAEQLEGKQPLTQFGRAMEQLGVDLDCAFSPQAKGRVERRNGVFQDRLVKEMRLAGISDLAAANLFLEEIFLPQLNQRFCVKAAQPADGHRAPPRHLNEVLSWEEQRVVQRDWTLSWQNRYFQISPRHEGLCLVGKPVVVRELRDGTIQLIKAVKSSGSKNCLSVPNRSRRSSPRRPRARWRPNLPVSIPGGGLPPVSGRGDNFGAESKSPVARRDKPPGPSGRPPLRSGLPPGPGGLGRLALAQTND